MRTLVYVDYKDRSRTYEWPYAPREPVVGQMVWVDSNTYGRVLGRISLMVSPEKTHNPPAGLKKIAGIELPLEPKEPDVKVETATLIDDLISCGAVKFGTFGLSSGITSDYYVDVRLAAGYPDILRSMARMLTVNLRDGKHVYAGVALGGVSLATACQLRTGHLAVIVRPEAKGHGVKNLVEGAVPEPGVPIVVIEDVATSGGSILRAVAALRGIGMTVGEARVVVDREQGAREALAKEGVTLRPLVTGTQLREARERVDDKNKILDEEL